MDDVVAAVRDVMQQIASVIKIARSLHDPYICHKRTESDQIMQTQLREKREALS